jgi:hypothetical protein
MKRKDYDINYNTIDFNFFSFEMTKIFLQTILKIFTSF